MSVADRPKAHHIRLRVSSVVRGVLILALLGALVLIVVGVASGGWEIQPILSGSMRPGFPVGGVVVVEREPISTLHVRDVVLFHPPTEPGVTYVHRIIWLKRTPLGTEIHTQGDDNAFPDPWTSVLEGKWAYQARFTVPIVGYAAVWDHSLAGKRYLLVIAVLIAAVAIGLGVAEVQGRRHETDGEDGDVDPSEAPSHPKDVAGTSVGAAGRT